MTNKSVIITSGGSQLLTQIALCVQLEKSFSDFHVIYIGENGDRLSPVLEQISLAFGMKYIGELPNLRWPKPLKKRKFNFFQTRNKLKKKNKTYLRTYVLDKYPILFDYQNLTLFLPIRHKMLEDILIVNALNPSCLFLTADGVVNVVSKRDGSDNRLLGVKTVLNIFPLKTPIYTPNYLIRENKKLGEVISIKEEILQGVFEKAITPKFSRIFLNLFEEIQPDYVIFSQHLALSRVCSEELENEYYKNIINELKGDKNCKILIKLHPRELEKKFKNLYQEDGEIPEGVQIFPINYSAIPIELMTSYISKSVLITANSSAPLSITRGNKIICYTYHKFDVDYQNEIKQFAQLNNCILREI